MTETEEFVQLLKLENGNLESVRQEEPFLDDVIAYLSMALAHDCMVWDDPERFIEPNLGLIESVARVGCLLKDQWAPEGILVYGGKMTVDDPLLESWSERGKALRDAILDAHLQAYGQENAERAYRETNTALTYMLAIGCARSTDLDGSLDFVQKCFRAAMNKLTAGGQ